MDLVTYYQSLEDEPVFPKKIVREKIREACGCSEATVYRYLDGTTTPNKPTKEAIAKALEMDPDTLFPLKEKEETDVY